VIDNGVTPLEESPRKNGSINVTAYDNSSAKGKGLQYLIKKETPDLTEDEARFCWVKDVLLGLLRKEMRDKILPKQDKGVRDSIMKDRFMFPLRSRRF